MIGLPVLWVALAVVAAIVIVNRLRGRPRAPGRRHPSRGVGVDVEADLIRACHGDRSQAERLIAHELERDADLSRPGAAIAALAKLRDDRR